MFNLVSRRRSDTRGFFRLQLGTIAKELLGGSKLYITKLAGQA